MQRRELSFQVSIFSVSIVPRYPKATIWSKHSGQNSLWVMHSPLPNQSVNMCLFTLTADTEQMSDVLSTCTIIVIITSSTLYKAPMNSIVVDSFHFWWLYFGVKSYAAKIEWKHIVESYCPSFCTGLHSLQRNLIKLLLIHRRIYIGGLQDRNINIIAGTTVENKGTLTGSSAKWTEYYVDVRSFIQASQNTLIDISVYSRVRRYINIITVFNP